jgi:hypothetical protein
MSIYDRIILYFFILFALFWLFCYGVAWHPGLHKLYKKFTTLYAPKRKFLSIFIFTASVVLKKRLVLILFCFYCVCVIWFAYAGVFLTALETPNDFGDAYGSLNTLFSGFAFIGLVMTIILQYDELKEQRKELKETRRELQGQKEQLKIQNMTSNLSRFDYIFFSLIANFRDITSELEYNDKTGKYIFEELFANIREELKVTEVEEHCSTREQITAFYSRRVNAVTKIWKQHKELENLDNYFICLHRILSRINSVEFMLDGPIRKQIEKGCSGLVRAQLSSYEVIMLFYYCLVKDHKKMRAYVNEYKLLDSIRPELLPEPLDILLYDYKSFRPDSVNRLQERFSSDQLREVYAQWKAGHGPLRAGDCDE